MKKTYKKLKTRFRKKNKTNKRKNKTIRNYARHAGMMRKGFETLRQPITNIGKSIGKQTSAFGEEYMKSLGQDELVGKQKISNKFKQTLNPKYNINYNYDDYALKENLAPTPFKNKYNIISENYIPPYVKPLTNM